MSVPWFVISVVFLSLLYIFFKPKADIFLNREVFERQHASCGRITKNEVVCIIILIGALVLFSTEKWIGIKTAETALMALTALIIFDIIDAPDVSSGVNRDIISFLAAVIGLTPMFVKAGIFDWAKPLIEPGILSLAASLLLFMAVITVMFCVLRFVDVPWGYTTIAFFSPILIPLYERFGLHPVLISVAVIAVGNSFFLGYQQPFIVIGD